MKRLIPFLLAGAAFAHDEVSLTGKWQIHTSIEGNENDQLCTFTQRDAAFSGTCTARGGEVKVTGKIDGRKVQFSYASEYEGQPLTVAFDGTIDDTTKIAGTVTVPEYSVSGEFSAIAAK